ncbi:Na+/H+ antiporter subunit A [Kribbella sp. NPDC049174]|uniref:Na+/H+ antiporter subunit A n=1 Tax=Kribbella sp. NPDC049174 TaxID=3364112 RepID=UPI0037110681
MLILVLAHFLAAAVAPTIVGVLGRRAFLALALVPASAFVWALTWTGPIADGAVRTEVISWVPTLNLDLAFALGPLQWVMMLVVTGIGALVLVYCAWYFSADEPGLSAFAGHFVAFAGAMLGLVISDDLLVLYVFWELTTVFSYLLIGHDPTKRASRTAAMQALIVTTFGGLAMLVGILLIGTEAGTFRISDVLADPPDGAAITVAVVLLLLGAISKSAIFPFHFWLPGAMAAPTPVSAYLHAAAMVKAGVYLVALTAPAFAGVPGWRGLLLSLGLFTMLIGGWRSLRQRDIKLLLAYGTVSQLGFLLVILSVGTRAAALAGLALLVAHALFKAALFLVVGIVDHQTGTRDLRKLSGVGRSAPVLAGAAVLAGASMAGLPPLAGFVAKESVYGALIGVARHGDGTGLGGFVGWVVLIGVVLGSALTVAYTARFLWGTFATKPGVGRTNVAPIDVGFLAAPVLLATLSLALGFLSGPQNTMLGLYADRFVAGQDHAELALWHGLGLALALSAVSLALGLILFWRKESVTRLQTALAGPWSAERGYVGVMRRLDRVAVEVTGLTQRGSVAIYLSVILLVVVLLPGSAMLAAAEGRPELVLWDNPGQLLVAVVVAIAAVLTTRSRRRLKAVVLVGVTGYGTATLFFLHGAPDLALTQVLVETVSLVVFVLVLRRLPEYFTDRPLTRRRYWRVAIGAIVAATVAGFMIVSTGARTAVPVSAGYPEEAVAYGGGRNIVNVTLVDIRAWDTMGEIAVLVAAATGVASLVFIGTRTSVIRRVRDLSTPDLRQRGRPVWLPGGATLTPERRSIIFEVVTRLIFHTIVVFSIYLLLSGHNNPGGGFAAGLVTGLALMVRYLAGGRYELDEAAPVDAGALMGLGLFVATVSGLAPLAFGGAVLQSAVVDLHLPLLGDVHLVTSVFFDVGVYLVVAGLMLDLLRSLGSGIDRQILRDESEESEEATKSEVSP